MRTKFGLTQFFLVGTLCLVLILSAGAQGVEASEDIKLQFKSKAQSQFDDFSRDVGLGLSYAPADPARTRGLLGFDIGVQVTAADFKKSTYMDSGFGGDAPSTLGVPTLKAAKGFPGWIFPGSFDVSASYTPVPNSNVRLLGGSVKYALMEPGWILPTTALRVSGTQLNGVSDLDMLTYGADLSFSKQVGVPIPFTPAITPFVGAGRVKIESTPNLGAGLDDYSGWETKFFGGAELSLPFLPSVVAEAEFAEVNRYTLRANIGL